MAQENTVIQEIPMICDAMTYIGSLHTTYIVLFRYYLHCVVLLLVTLCRFVITYIVLFRYYLHCVVLFYLQSIVTLLHLHTLSIIINCNLHCIVTLLTYFDRAAVWIE